VGNGDTGDFSVCATWTGSPVATVYYTTSNPAGIVPRASDTFTSSGQCITVLVSNDPNLEGQVKLQARYGSAGGTLLKESEELKFT
jgi:hypothetical protein